MKKDFQIIILLFSLIISVFLDCSKKKENEERTTLPPLTEESQFANEIDEEEPSENYYSTEPVETAGELKILSHGPIGESKGQVQIRIDFGNPLIPLTTLSDQEREEILSHFILKPQIEGKFRLLGNTTVVFEPEHSLPMATNFRVTVTKGLKDIDGRELEANFTWEFQTPLPRIEIYPRNNTHHVNIDNPIHIRSNVALNITSLKQNIELFKTISDQPVRYELLENDRNPKDDQDIGMYRMVFTYLLNPMSNLEKDTKYTVKIKPGVMTQRGNRPTIREIVSTFQTYPPFRFKNTGFCSYCGNKLVTIPYLAFSNNPQLKKIEDFVLIDPKPEKTPFHQYNCTDYGIGLDDDCLEPNTSYTITLNGDLKDVFGQTLENPQSITITTGGLTPKMWGPSGYQIITPNIEPKLGIKTVNIDRISYKLLSLRPEDVLVRERLDYYYSIEKLIKEIKSDEKQLSVSLNEIGVGKSHFDLKPYLRGKNYGAVAYTFRSPSVQCYSHPIRFNGLILRTNIGIYTQFHPTGGIIKLNQLTDGKPVPGANIKIYREDDLPRLEKIWDLITDTHIGKINPCFESSSDADGVLTLSAEETAQCTQRRIRNKIINELYPPEADPDDILYDQERFGFADPPRLLIVAEKGNDWTFLQTERGGNPSIWQFGVLSDWEAERPLSRGTIFSDQNIYRPGDTVKMQGISRYLLYGRLFTGEGMEYTIKLRDPHGAEKTIDKVRVDRFGTFHFDIPTKEGQYLGNYSVIAETPHQGLKFYGNFRLAEFRVPEFEVKMDIDKKIALPNEPIQISWEGKYYFGAPMSEVKSSLNITRRKTHFHPKNWEGFSFWVPPYLEDQKVSLMGRYHSETISLNNEGKATKTIKINPNDVPYPMTYLCDVEVEDVSKQTISAQKHITMLPNNQLVGIQLSDWIVAKKDTIDASIIVVSPEGKALSGVPVTVKLIKKEYHSIKTKTSDERFHIEHNLVKKIVETKEILSTSQPVKITFIPQEAGSFIIWAELKKKPKSGTAAATSIWVAGEDYVPWEDRGEDKLEIIMDKKEYEVGDEAVAFIQSPYPEAELFLTVCREKVFLKEANKIKGSAYTYRFRVTEEMLPNAYVGAVLFRLGKPIVPVEEEVGKHMERIGFAPFKVSLSSKYLDVQIEPDREMARPAEELDVNIQITRSDKQGHPSELTVMVVDEAVLSLTGYTPPDLVKVVYEQRGLSARINDNRPFIITEEELLQKGTGYGGGILEGMAGPRIRKEFLKLAYYNPNLLTDETGRAKFHFKLPDNLTTWKIMVVAVGQKHLFGYGEEKLVVSQPFILRPVQPRFARIGDQFLAGVAVTNLTEAAGQVSVKTKIQGESIILDNSKSELPSIMINPGQSKTLLFPFRTKSVGKSTMQFTASFNGIYNSQAISESDALQTSLEIQDLSATETVVAVGETEEQMTQKIKIDDTIRKDTGGLNILLSSTALTDIGEGAKYLVNYPYGCLEQTSSRLLALIQLKYLSDKYNFSLQAVKPVDLVIQANLKKVLLMQHNNGGFKFWPTSDEANCFLSPYVAYLFKRCRELGYKIDDEVTKRLLEFLDNSLRNPCYPFITWKGLAEYRINILMGMHHLGRKDETYFEEYFNKRNGLSYGAQIQLAYLLFHSSQWKPEAQQMLEEIKNGMFVTAQTAHFESPRDLPPSWLFMYSPIITTSDAIKLFLIIEPESPFIVKFARYILNARKNGRWRNTYENAKAIDALVEISLKREATPPDFTAKILIAGRETLKHMFKGHQYKPKEKFIPIDELPDGLSDIKIMKKGAGTLYYTLSYAYRLKVPQTARKEGFSIKRIVKNQNTGKTISQYEENPPEVLKIQAGDVLEIELEYNIPQTGYHLIIDDPIPAGLEAIDVSLKTTSTRYRTRRQSRVNRGHDSALGYWGNPINHTELRDDRVVLFADAVRPGIYKYTYMIRATTSGTFFWPATNISLMYEPEQFGTCAEGFVSVSE